MALPDPLTRLIEELVRLPGIGPKGAQRLAFYLLKTPRDYTDRLIEALPALQYVEGEFRPRFMLEEKLTVDDIQLPASEAIFDFNGSAFDVEDVRREIFESILDSDRFQPVEITGLPDETVAVAYYGWRTSPYLTRQFFPEWTLGICIVTKIGDLVFAHDTAGIVVNRRSNGALTHI